MFPQKHKSTIFGLLIARLHYLLVLVGFCILGFATFLGNNSSQTALAATSSTLNFQGRLYQSNGAIVPDGYYNIQFKLYDGGTQGGPGGTGQANAGTNLWTESYYDSNGVTAGNDNRLRVVNGYFSANLGSQTAFGAINWDQELWLTMNVGGSTQTATPTYDGEMLATGNTRTKLTGVPYAFRAGAVTDSSGNAYTGDDLIQKAPGSVQSASSASSLIRVNQTGVGGLLQLQSGGSDAFTINNSGNVVAAGTGTFQGASLTVGTTSQSGSLILNDGSSNTATLSLAAFGQNTVITIPDPGAGTDTICLQGLNNCAGTGDIHQNGNSFGAAVTIGSNDGYGLNLETNNTTVASFSSSGAAIFKNASNSAAGFVIQRANGTSLLTANTGTGDVTITQGGLVVNGTDNPATPTLTSSGTGGTLSAGTYYYRLAATNSGRRTFEVKANPYSVTTAGSTSKNTLTWSAVTNADGYKIYRSIDGGTTWYVNTVSSATTSIVDDGTNYTWATAQALQAYNDTGNISITPDNYVNFGFNAANSPSIGYQSETNTLAIANYDTSGGIDLYANTFNLYDTTGYNQNLTITNTGATTFKNRTNSTTAFQIQDASGASVLNVETTATNHEVSVGSGSGFAGLAVNGGTSQVRDLYYRTAGSDRFILRVDNTAESGSNAGSNFLIRSYDDSGAYLGTPLTIFRNDGSISLRNTINSANGFNILQADGSTRLSVDTQDSQGLKVYGNSSDEIVEISNSAGLQVKTTGTTAWTNLGTDNASTNILNLYDNGNVSVGSVSGTGAVTFNNSTNSTTAFQIQNAAGSSLFTADSSNKKITTLDLNVGSPSSVGDWGRLFSDDFEGAVNDKWTGGTSTSGTSTALPSQTQKRNGKFSERINATGTGAAYLSTSITGATTTTMRGYIYISSQTNDYTLMELRNGGSAAELYLENTTGKIAAYNTANSTAYVSTNVPSTGAWHQVEMDVTYNATTGSITVYVDGTQVINQTNINTGTTLPNTFRLGESTVGRAADIYYDDVVVDSVRPGDSANLYVADSLHVAGTSSFGNSVLIQTSTNVANAFVVQDASRNNILTADTANNRVLIGTGATNVAGEKLTVQTTGTGYGFLQTNGTISLGSYIDGSAGQFGTYSNHPLDFFTGNGNYAQRIGTDGSVIFKNYTNSATGFQVQNAAGTGNNFIVDTQNNRVGINAAPSYALDVSSADNTQLRLQGSTAEAGIILNPVAGSASKVLFQDGGTTKFEFGKSAGNAFNLYDNANGKDVFQATSSGVVLIQPVSGNVGIGAGATNPQALLHVSGAGGGSSLFRVSDTTATARDVLDIADGGAATFRNQTDSAAAFQIQNAAGVSQFTADTTNGGLTLGSASGTGTIAVGQSTATNTITIGAAIGAGATQTINIGTSATATSATTLTLGSLIGTSTTTIQSGSGNINLQAAGASTIGVIQIGAGGAGSTTPDYLALDVKSTTGDPAGGANGYMYYNTFDNKFRCYEAGAWKDCDTNTAGTVTLQSAYGNDVDGSDSIIALTSADDSLIFRNPASGGTDSSYVLTIDQLSSGATGGLSIQSAGTGNLLLVTDTTATARDVLTIADGGATTFRNQTNSSAAFLVQNAAGSSLLTIDTSGNNINLLGNNSGELQAWQTNSNTLTTTMSDPDSVVVNGYIYTIGGNGTTTNYAKINGDGSVGAFATTTALPSSVRRNAVVYANGYIYTIGGYDGASVISTVYYSKVNTDGTLGSWQTGTSLPAARSYGGAVAYNGYIFFMGGSDGTSGVTSVYAIKTYANGSMASSWTDLSGSTPLLGARLGGAVTMANGYVYFIGGKTTEASTTGQTNVYYARINLNGTLGTFSNGTNTSFTGRHNARAGVANGYIYVFGGRASAADRDDVQYSALSTNGSNGSWTTATNLLPSARSGQASTYANGYFYELGGGGTNTVFYASTPRVKIAGSLDLVGPYGQTLADAGGAGSLTSGNTKVLGALDVQGQGTFAQGIVVDKDLRVGGSAFFQNTADSTTAFIIQNSAGTSNLFVADTTNTRIGIGTSSPAYTLDVAGDINGQAIRDAIGWVRNQGGVEQLKTAINNGSFGGGSSVNKQSLTANDLSFFDSSTVNSNSKSFASAVFDGRYIYFVPFYRATGTTFHGQVTRYDTTKDYSSTSSYSVFDMTGVNANSKGFLGAVFDGRYIYYIPYATAAGTGNGQITRYDTQASFTSTSSYSVYDTTAVNANSKGFVGGVFDGRYLYLVPYYTGSAYSGQITRYDTTASFTAAGSYSVYDTTAVNANSKGFYGAVFDGKYIYFVPNVTAAGPTYSGQITRYDTTGGFTTAGSYSVYDTTAVNASSKGFQGAVFDGRYIYYVPYATASSTASGLVTRYDTYGTFNSSSSYSTYDMGNVSATAKGFDGGFFDGKYVYFIPHYNVATPTFHGNIARYDTSQSFTSSSSYTVLNMASTNASSIGFVGGGFDGHYLYLSPYSLNGSNNGQITRVRTYAGGVDTVNSINKIATSSEFLMNSNGSIYLQNNTDSTSAFKVLNSSGGTNLEVNNTYGTVGLGTTSVSDAKIYTSTGSLVGLRVNQTGSSDLFQLQNTGTSIFTVSSTGAVLSKNSSNSTAAFAIQNAAGTQLFNVDTSNSYVINNGIASLGNEVQNPSFEAGSGTNASGWDLAGGGTITTSATDAHTGNKYLQGSGNSTNHTIGAATKIMAVNPGDVIYYEGWVKNSAGANGTGGFYLSLYDKDMAGSGFSTGDTWTLPGTTYTLRTNRFTIPAGTYYVGLSATVRSDSTSGTWYFDDLYMKKSNEGAPILLKNNANSTTAFQIQNAAGTALFVADTTNSRIGINTSTSSYDLGFGGDSARTIGLQTRSTNAAGSNLTISAGAAGSGASAYSGGTLTLQGGAAGGTGNANGGSVTISGGAGTGTGVQGLVNLSTTAFTSAATQTFAASGSLTSGLVDQYATIPVNATATSLTVTIPAPATGNQTVGRLLYIAAVNGSNDFTISLAGTSITIVMKANSTATLIWNGTGWTAAGASSSTDLQSAYNNTVSSAGGAELVLNAAGGAADGLTVRNNGTTPIIGGLLEVQSSTGSNLFAVNNNATEYATNGGSETAGGTSTTFPSNTWSQSATGGTQATISRTITSGEFATGVAAAKVVTTGATTANQGIANQIAVNGTNTALTANLTYTVAFTVKGTANFTTLDVVYSRDGTNTSTTSCTTGKTVTQTVWTRIGCTFTAPSSGITTSNAIFIRQSDSNSNARTFYIDNLSVTVSANTNHATDGSVDSALGTNWTTFGAGTAVTRDTTTLYDTSGSVKVDTTNNTDRGVTNNLTITPSTSTQYLVTFYAKLGSGTFTDIRVRYSRDGGTNFVSCADYNTQTLSTSVWTKITCLFTTDSTTATNADLIIDQPTAPGSTRTFYVDALSVTLNTNNANNVQIGGGSKGGPVTLFTLDRSAGAPIAANNDAYLGSMYYDTTTGRIQCYESAGWGTCGAPPDNIVNLNPEYAGAVLNGTGVGTMTADLCSNDTALSVNTSLCSTGQAKNFYKWTSPQATQQTYSIYVSYQLPSTFNGFSSDDTVQLVARVDSTTNASVTYQMFKSTGSAVTQCGSGETDVITGGGGSANTWYSYGINGNEATGCSFTSSSAGNYLLFKINLKANSNANAYVSTLSFTTTGR